MAEETTATVRIGEREVTLHRPTDMLTRMEIWEAAVTSQMRGRGAAIGMCWTDLHRPKARYGGNMSEYGAAVMRELLEQGVPRVQLLHAGNVALNLCVDGLFTVDDLERAAGNSNGEEESAA